MGLGRTWVGSSCRGRLSWCVRHIIGDSGRWGSTWNPQRALSGFFAGKETAEFKEVAVYQYNVSREVATLHAWVAFMIKTGDGEKRDNAIHFDSLHAL